MRSFNFAAAFLLAGVCTAVPAPDYDDGFPKKFKGPSDPARFRFFPTPSEGGICDMDTDPDGVKLWYQDLVAATMGVFDPITKKFQEYQIPYSEGPHGTPPFVGNVSALQCVVRTGKDGMVYGGAGTRNEIVQVNPVTRKLKIFAPPKPNPFGNLLNFNDAWAADEGLFFSSTTANVVSLFNYKTHKFTFYKCKTPDSGPLGMRTDKHNNLWFTNFFGQFISMIPNGTHEVQEFHNVPQPGGLFPEVLRSSTENQKYLWANAFGAGGFIRIDVAKKEFKIFSNPKPNAKASFPFENDNDYCGRVWYSSPTLNILTYYDPKTHKWTEVTVPKIDAPTGDFEVTMHKGPLHSMWFTEGTVGSIGQYKLDADCRGEPD